MDNRSAKGPYGYVTYGDINREKVNFLERAMKEKWFASCVRELDYHFQVLAAFLLLQSENRQWVEAILRPFVDVAALIPMNLDPVWLTQEQMDLDQDRESEMLIACRLSRLKGLLCRCLHYTQVTNHLGRMTYREHKVICEYLKFVVVTLCIRPLQQQKYGIPSLFAMGQVPQVPGWEMDLVRASCGFLSKPWLAMNERTFSRFWTDEEYEREESEYITLMQKYWLYIFKSQTFDFLKKDERRSVKRVREE